MKLVFPPCSVRAANSRKAPPLPRFVDEQGRDGGGYEDVPSTGGTTVIGLIWFQIGGANFVTDSSRTAGYP